MKLSQYAKKAGVSYRTAFRWWKAGQLKGYQTASKTIIITEEDQSPLVGPTMVAIYARVSSAEHRANLERQAERLLDYCAAKGYQVHKVVKEVASGVNDSRPKFLALLDDQRVQIIVVEHKDRATRFGFHYLERLLLGQGRAIEVVNLAENDREDLFFIRSTARYIDEDRVKLLDLRGRYAELALTLAYQGSENLRLERKYDQWLEWNQDVKLMTDCLLCDVPIRASKGEKLCPSCRVVRNRLMNRRSDHYKRKGIWMPLRDLCKPEEIHFPVERLDLYEQ